jgi:hypothetical protein
MPYLSPRRRFVARFLVTLATLAPLPAAAHAIVIASTPDVNATVAGAAVPIVLHFNSRIDKNHSRLSLYRPDGSGVTLPLRTESPPDELDSTAGDLPPGTYRLRWQVLSVDGHITRGDIPFQVGP